MPKIPWNVIGPAASVIVLILGIVFAFILKFQKQSKMVTSGPVPPSVAPRASDTLSKKSLCLNHEGRISSNETGIKNVDDKLTETQKLNRQDHKEIFNKIDVMGKDIIKEIVKNNSQ